MKINGEKISDRKLTIAKGETIVVQVGKRNGARSPSPEYRLIG
ncbi:hypothetical protein EVA_06294 [gut metagenome]|uniref:RNA-binding S4 domain-containing protein n=1 Tax=gut metagenome TaxID=749906 RepID=J9GXW7_9ZZZZ